MSVEHNISSSKINWKIINWMRGLAALYVVINHARGQLFTNVTQYSEHVAAKANWHWWEKLSFIIMQHTNLGTEFVIVFFLLSGFSIAHSLNNNHNTSDFYVRRAIRLYPPYALGIIWALIVFFIIKEYSAPAFFTSLEHHRPLKDFYDKFTDWRSIISNLLYLPKNNYITPQYWSLPFEVLFYLIAPWAIRRLKQYGLATVILYLAGWIWMKYNYFDDEKDPIILQFLTDYNIYFFVGIIFYTYKDNIIRSFKLSRTQSLILLAFIFEVAMLTKSYLFHQVSNKFTGIIMVVFTYILLSSGLKYNIRIKWLEKIGEYSYTLYVTHFATIYIVKAVLYHFGMGFYDIYTLYAWYIGIIAPVAIAYVLYYVAEYPALTYLNKLRNKTPIN